MGGRQTIAVCLEGGRGYGRGFQVGGGIHLKVTQTAVLPQTPAARLCGTS